MFKTSMHLGHFGLNTIPAPFSAKFEARKFVQMSSELPQTMTHGILENLSLQVQKLMANVSLQMYMS